MIEDLNFHMTFPPQPLYLGRILKIANGENMSTEEIAEITGIPQGRSSGKVRPHISYAIAMGLLKENDFSRTDLGDAVLQEDSSFSEELTQLLCHALITSVTGATMWNFTYRTLFPNSGGRLTKTLLTEQMKQKYGSNAKSAPVFSMYTKQFTELDLLTETTDAYELHTLPVEKDYIYVYGYSLLHEWETVFPIEVEITEQQIATLRFGAIFGWDKTREFEVLKQLCDKGVIGINSQLVPYTVKKYIDSEKIIPKLYSLLL